MKSSSAFPSADVEFAEARAELDAILCSVLRPNSNMAQLLRYVCEKHFQGRDHELKEYCIAVEVFGRSAEFDSSRDSIVRVEAHRLRSRLSRYYNEEGRGHTLRILIAPGNYVPQFFRVPAQVHTEPQRSGNLPSTSESPPVLPAPVDAAENDHAVVAVRPEWFRGKRRFILLLGSFLLAAAAILSVSIRSRQARLSSSVPIQRPVPLSANAADVKVLQILCGLSSPSFVDARGEIWSGDQFYSGGDPEAITPKPLAFTDDPNLYYRRRRATTADFGYDIPLAPGSYELRLYFADAFFGENNLEGGGEGSRIFDVLANGAYLLKNFDVISDAGGSNTADIKVFKEVHPAADGMLHLSFRSRKNRAFVNAIQILKARPNSIAPQRFLMGTHSYRDAKGRTWEADRFYRGGVRLDEPTKVETTQDGQLWRNERFGNFVYSIPVASGSNYRVTMRFRDNAQPSSLSPTDAANIFDVYFNGRLLLKDFIVENKRWLSEGQVKTFTHLQPNAQGKLIFTFVPTQNYALVNSIEVIDESTPE